MTCRDLLIRNGYEEVDALIDQALAKIEAKGTKQRRNWWDILAGDAYGQPCVREGIEFPVLRVAQIRQGRSVTPNAICRNPKEQPPDVVATKRWPKKATLPRRAKRPTRKESLHPNKRTQAS